MDAGGVPILLNMTSPHVRQFRTQTMPCPHCESQEDFLPGRVDWARGVEIRTCPRCDRPVETSIYIEPESPGEAEVWD